MSSEDAISFGCRIVAEFEDDSTGFVATDAEPLPERIGFVSPAIPASLQPVPFPPSRETAAAARKFWLQVIRRFTEPAPDKKHRLRVKGSAVPNHAKIFVEVGRQWYASGGTAGTLFSQEKLYTGSELDISDKWCLVLTRVTEGFHPKSQPDGTREITETFTPIPWTEITNFRFELT